MLNFQSPIPLYRQLADILMEGIRSGDYHAVGARIPSEPQLAKDYGIGRPTVRQAIDVLVRKGMLERRRGSGTYVRAREQEIDLFSLAGTSSAFLKRALPWRCNSSQSRRPKSRFPRERTIPLPAAMPFYLSRLNRVDGAPVLHGGDLSSSGAVQGHRTDRSAGRPCPRWWNPILHASLGRAADLSHRLPGWRNSGLMAVEGGHTGPDRSTGICNFKQAQTPFFRSCTCNTEPFVFSQQIGGLKP
jgi:GntR family transcriptional regulator